VRNILLSILTIFVSVTFSLSQSNYKSVVNILEKHAEIRKSLYKKLLKNQLNNIKKNDGSIFKGYNEYFLNDSTLISLNTFENRTIIYIQENKNDTKLEYVYRDKNKFSKRTLFQKFPIGKTYYYQKNKIIKIENNDSLYSISPDSIISIIDHLFSINISEINYDAYVNRNSNRLDYTIEINRDLLKGPRYYILYDGNNSQIKIKGFYLEIDGNTGEVLIQREVAYTIPSCGN
jgi:hypothetical protein